MKRLLFALGAKPASHCPETPGRSATWLWVGHRRGSEALALAQAGTSDLPGPVTGASRVVPSETTDVSRAEKQLLKTTFGYFSEEIQNADSKEWMYLCSLQCHLQQPAGQPRCPPQMAGYRSGHTHSATGLSHDKERNLAICDSADGPTGRRAT